MRRFLVTGVLVIMIAAGLAVSNAAALTLTGQVRVPQVSADFATATAPYTSIVASEAIGTSGLAVGLSTVNGTDAAMCFTTDTQLNGGDSVSVALTGGKFNFSTATSVGLVVPSSSNTGSTTSDNELAFISQSSATDTLSFTIGTGKSMLPNTSACLYVAPSSGTTFSLPDILVSQGASNVQFTVTKGTTSSTPLTYVGVKNQVAQNNGATSVGTFVQSINTDGKFYTTSNVSVSAQLSVDATTTTYKQKKFATNNVLDSGTTVVVTVTGDLSPFSSVKFDSTGDSSFATTLTINDAKTSATKTISTGAITFSSSAATNFQFAANPAKAISSLAPYTITIAETPSTSGATARTFTWNSVIPNISYNYVRLVSPYFNLDSTNFYTYIQIMNTTGKSSAIFAKASDRAGNVYFGKVATALNPYGGTVLLASDIISAVNYPTVTGTNSAVSLDLYLYNLTGPTAGSTTNTPADAAKVVATSHMRTFASGAERTIPISVESVNGGTTSAANLK